MKTRLFSLWLGSFFSSLVAAAPSARFDSQWVLPTRPSHDFELRPHERTRPIVMGDILYFANLDGDVYAMHRTENYVLWHKKLPGGVEGALVYGRSKIVVGDMQGNLYALNARDGSEAWHFKVPAEWTSPPVVTRDRIFAVTSNDELYALGENNGKELWHYPHRGDEKMTVHGVGGTVVFGNEVFQGFSDGYLVALTAKEGKVIWSKKLRTRDRFYDVDMTPFVDEKSVIAASFDGKLYSLDRLTSAANWVFPVGVYGGVLVEDEKVYFAGLDRNFYALDRATGTVVWKTPFEKGVGMAPVRVGDFLIVTTSGDPIYLLDRKNGRVVWEESLGTGTLSSAIVAGDNTFYCMSNYGNLYAFELRTFSERKKEPETLSSPSAIHRDIEIFEPKADS